jgi:hypothetical protein
MKFRRPDATLSKPTEQLTYALSESLTTALLSLYELQQLANHVTYANSGIPLSIIKLIRTKNKLGDVCRAQRALMSPDG